MEVIEFNKVLSKSLKIIEVGIKKGYFDASKKNELDKKLISIFNNGIVYDLPGTAIYGMYSSRENKLYFNAKVFQSEEEALVYILHEMKHGLDCYEGSIGFEKGDKGVGINEGATQRFATNIAEEILQIQIPTKTQTSLGIQLETNLDEYQIEDKLNELFCIAMGISMEEFLFMQNDEKKEHLKYLIDKFNQYASYENFHKALDGIYKIQEETWFDENGNLLNQEKSPTLSQTKRAMELINCCKQELLKYAVKANPDSMDKIKGESFMMINESGEIIRDEEETNNQNHVYENEIMTEENIVAQADYLNYQQNILNQIGNQMVDHDFHIVFVTEFRYESERSDKVVYFRKGEDYHKMIIPMQDNRNLDMANISVQKVDDINEIKNEIEDCEAEFGVIANGFEYSKILNMLGESAKAQNILNKWNYFLSKQDELEQIRHKVDEQSRRFKDEIENLRNSFISEDANTQQTYFDDLLSKEIVFGSIIVTENGINVISSDGLVKFVSPNEEEYYISQIKNAVENGTLKLNRMQLNLLNSYMEKSSRKM